MSFINENDILNNIFTDNSSDYSDDMPYKYVKPSSGVSPLNNQRTTMSGTSPLDTLPSSLEFARTQALLKEGANRGYNVGSIVGAVPIPHTYSDINFNDKSKDVILRYPHQEYPYPTSSSSSSYSSSSLPTSSTMPGDMTERFTNDMSDIPSGDIIIIMLLILLVIIAIMTYKTLHATKKYLKKLIELTETKSKV